MQVCKYSTYYCQGELGFGSGSKKVTKTKSKAQHIGQSNKLMNLLLRKLQRLQNRQRHTIKIKTNKKIKRLISGKIFYILNIHHRIAWQQLPVRGAF